MRNNGKPKSKRGPKTPEGKARALANLMPPMKPGETRNPRGRPSAGLSIREWMNQMQDWSSARLDAVMKNDDAPACQRAAARCWLDAMTRAYTSSGAPVAGSDLDRLCEQTAGKATQPVELTGPGGEPLAVKHDFDFDRYSGLYRRISGGIPAAGSANGNG